MSKHKPPVPADWFTPLREHDSLGATRARPGSLAGLHQARREHLGQFWTPDALVGYIWRLLTPAMDAALADTPEPRQLPLFDNAVGTGRLFQFADAKRHRLAGCDPHEASVSALAQTAEDAGFDADLHPVGMEHIHARGHAVALINPPFSVPLEAPELDALPCTTHGRYGPGTAAVSHAYALHQARRAADVVAAILPTPYAHEAVRERSIARRLAALIDLAPGAFAEQGTQVATTLVVLDHREAYHHQPQRLYVRDITTATPPALDLTLAPAHHYHPVTRHKHIDTDAAAITTPVTGDTRVAVSHNSRRLGLRFRCGLTEAKVRNAVLGQRLQREMDGDGKRHRYPRGVRYTGQGALDLEVHLTQPDPLGSFEVFLDSIRHAGGAPSVDPSVYGYLRRRLRRDARQTTPNKHVVYQPGNAVPSAGAVTVRARHAQTADPSKWLSPVLNAGDELSLEPHRPGVYRFERAGQHFTVAEESIAERFEIVSQAGSGGWVTIHPGRHVAYPDIAAYWRRRAEKQGIDRWLSWDYQLEDLIEAFIAPRGQAISWDMALGKGRLALAAAMLAENQCNLIVVESRLIDELRIEIGKIGLDRRVWQVIDRPQRLDTLKRVNIIAYERLRTALPGRRPRHTYARALRRRIGTAIVDEGHRIAKPGTQQTQALWALSPKRRLVLTGTPIPNYAQDVLPPIAWAVGDGTATQPYGYYGPHLDPAMRESMRFTRRGVDAFREDYLSFEWVTHQYAEDLEHGAKRQVPRLRNVARFREWIAPHLKRRLIQEPEVRHFVQVELPERHTTTLDWDPAHYAYYRNIAKNFAAWYREHRERALEAGRNINIVAVLQRIQAILFATNAPFRGVDGFGAYTLPTSKERYLVERLLQLKAEGHRTILYTRQPPLLRRIARQLAEHGGEPVCFDGGDAIKQRNRRLERRFRQGDAPWLLASHGVTETGLNIPQASRIVMAERAWNGKTEEQLVRRAVRPDQMHRVSVENVHLGGSIDEYMAQMVAHKADAATVGLDYGLSRYDEGDFEHLDTILERFVRELEGEPVTATC